ncbi:hypothetical protein [Moraxella lacunata]
MAWFAQNPKVYQLLDFGYFFGKMTGELTKICPWMMCVKKCYNIFIKNF